MKIMRQFTVLIAVVGVSLFALQMPAAAQQAKAKAKAKASASAAKRPRVLFVEPENGATVTSPVHLKFGVQNFEISPVPPGDVTTARPGVGHYHIGIDQSCLARGKAIEGHAVLGAFRRRQIGDRHAAPARSSQAGAPDWGRSAQDPAWTVRHHHRQRL